MGTNQGTVVCGIYKALVLALYCLPSFGCYVLFIDVCFGCVFIRFVKEISGSVQSHELKKLLSDTAMINPHIPNLLNIAARYVL